MDGLIEDPPKKLDKRSVTIELKKHGNKFYKWTQEFLNPKSKTYGNATKSAMEVYNCKNYAVAGAIGCENFKKLKNLGVTFTELGEVSIQEWYRVLAAKALKGGYEQTKDFMETFGLIEKSGAPQNQNNFQFNFGNLAEAFSQARKERGLDENTIDNKLGNNS